MALVYENISDMCSSIHVLYQNTVLEYSCWGGLLLGGGETFGTGGEGCVPLCRGGERSRSFRQRKPTSPGGGALSLNPSKLALLSFYPPQKPKNPKPLGRQLTCLCSLGSIG